MRKAALSLLLVISIFTNNSYASGGFCTMLEKICQQKNIDADAFSDFFQKVGVNVYKATDLGMYANVFKMVVYTLPLWW
jgi:hypothetical protein